MRQKDKLLISASSHVKSTIEKIRGRLEVVKTIAHQSLKGLSKMLPEDQAVFMSLRGNAHRRILELTHLSGSPYFTKCSIVDENGNNKNYYFAKHEFSEESIYSWIAPISSIRFENPGPTSYKLPNGVEKTLTITEKETYMIVGGKILLFAIEALNKPRELIYQEHFTQQKSVFMLPEIVAQMEKAQDQVIRAHHKGPLVISGPAGSGKTTLALHRVAYLIQVPDTAQLYRPENIIVLVQDNGTKNYFSKLLPSLGINDVKIITFSEWAFQILGLEEYSYMERYGENEEEKDLYEDQKLKILRDGVLPSWNKNIYKTLHSSYSKYFSARNSQLFNTQKDEKKLDRFDLVILLKSYFEKYKKFEIKRKYQTFVKHELVFKIEKTVPSYSLMIIDEFQNYLPEQLEILKNCLSDKTKSVVYVGDMAQQVKLGTITNWDSIGEIIPGDRNILLHKVYRNTKNILSFIQGLGYKIELPEGLKDGPRVTEKITHTITEEIQHIKNILPHYSQGGVGVISKDDNYLQDFKKEFKDIQNIHVLTMLEAQGVEFDLVCLVGMRKDFFNLSHVAPEHKTERNRMQKDLLYVALTRAITELHILGSEKLKDIL